MLGGRRLTAGALGAEASRQRAMPLGCLVVLRLRPRGVLLAREGVEDVREEHGVEIPAGRVAGGESCLGREVLDQDRETAEREPAAIEIAEVDAVEAEEVRLERAPAIPEDRGER